MFHRIKLETGVAIGIRIKRKWAKKAKKESVCLLVQERVGEPMARIML